MPLFSQRARNLSGHVDCDTTCLPFKNNRWSTQNIKKVGTIQTKTMYCQRDHKKKEQNNSADFLTSGTYLLYRALTCCGSILSASSQEAIASLGYPNFCKTTRRMPVSRSVHARLCTKIVRELVDFRRGGR